MTLSLIVFALLGRVTEWIHYPHYGGGNCIITMNDLVLSGTSGGILFAHYSAEDDRLVADSGWSSPGLLSYDRVSHISSDQQGNLWVSLSGGGIDVFTAQGDKTHYNQIDGLPLNLGINQTIPDSVVYVATTQGLCIKEVGYFEVWDTYSTGGGLPSDNINCMISSDSGLYVGTTSGLVFLPRSASPADPDSWVPQEIDPVSITSLEWQGDTLWAATSNKLFRKPPDSSWEDDPLFPGENIASMSAGPGGFAVGCTNRCYILKNGVWYLYGTNLNGEALADLMWYEGRLMGVLANTYSENRAAGSGLALLQPDSTWRRTFPDFGPVSNDLRSSAILYDGSVLSSSNRTGASVFTGSEWISVNSYLTSRNQCYAVCESGNGAFISSLGTGVDWLGWDGEGVTASVHFTNVDGLVNNRVFHAASGGPNTVWFAHRTLYETEQSGITRLNWIPGDPSSASFSVLTGAGGLPSKEVNAVLPMGSRYAWAGTDEGLVYVDADRQMVLDTWASQSGLPSSIVTSLSMDRTGTLFVGTASGLAFVKNDDVTAVDEIDVGIQTLQCDNLGSVWVATSDGLKRYFISSGTVEEYTPFNSPLPQGSVYSMSIDDGGGYIWLATNHGLWRGELETGLSGDGSGASVYPDPFLPGNGDVLGIAGIPDEPVQIRLFDLTGALVYEYSSQGRDDFSWDGIAEDGSQVASGVYMLMITGGSYEPVLIKFALVR